MLRPHVCSLKFRRLPRDQRLRLRDELRQRHRPLVAFAARAHADCAAASSLSPKTRMYGVFWLAKSRILAFIFSLRSSTSTRRPASFSASSTLSGVSHVPLADGHQAHLHRREPQRKRSGIVLDEHAEEPLHRAEQRAMHHHRLMALAVFADVFKLEARGQIEVELHRRELPQAAEHVDELHVDLGAVERGFAGESLEGEPALREHVLRARPRHVPSPPSVPRKSPPLLRIARRQLDTDIP